jgi:hypothetical protein
MPFRDVGGSLHPKPPPLRGLSARVAIIGQPCISCPRHAFGAPAARAHFGPMSCFAKSSLDDNTRKKPDGNQVLMEQRDIKSLNLRAVLK